MDNLKLELAIRHAGVEAHVFLGEGAWHYAWKVRKNGADFVLRIPKETAYGKPVLYNEAVIKAEYGGTELYYASVNKAVKGAALEYFTYYVSEGLTYTLESFVGTQLDLSAMTEATAFQVGKDVGNIYRKTEEIPHGLEGFGFLAWSEANGLHGSIAGDAREGIKEESEEQLADYEVLCAARPEFKDERVERAIQLATELRLQRFTAPFLTNQDASPENILMHGDRVCLIDPFPIIYYPRGMAGNFMNLYETYFIALADTERYRKHEFGVHQVKLKGMAEGFLAGYSGGNAEIACEVRGEQVLQLLETAFSHLQLLQGDLSEEAEIRYGNKKDIAERLIGFSKELNRLAAFEFSPLIHLKE